MYSLQIKAKKILIVTHVWVIIMNIDERLHPIFSYEIYL